MKWTIAAFLCLVLLAGYASAYVINFEAPSTVESGSVIYITGTSTLPAGFSSEMIFYKKAPVGNNEIARIPFIIQEDGSWFVQADTAGWKAGEYTMSIPANSQYSYGSSSTTLRAFTVTGGPAATSTMTVQPTETMTISPEITGSPGTGTIPQPTKAPFSFITSIAAATLGLFYCSKRLF